MNEIKGLMGDEKEDKFVFAAFALAVTCDLNRAAWCCRSCVDDLKLTYEQVGRRALRELVPIPHRWFCNSASGDSASASASAAA
jgi:hypothetical protein